jgi:hypothetical protein
MGPGCVKMGMFEVVSCRMGVRQFDDVHASYPGSGRAAHYTHNSGAKSNVAGCPSWV